MCVCVCVCVCLWLFRWLIYHTLAKYLASVRTDFRSNSAFKTSPLSFFFFLHYVAAYRHSTSSAVLCYVVFQAPRLCGGILGTLQLPKFPNNSGNTWQSIRCSAMLFPCKLFACTHINIVTQGRSQSLLITVALLPFSLSLSLSPSQACIDDNVDMVTFLVEHGAGINQPDNEGWIPLHAAASCGYLDIAE